MTLRFLSLLAATVSVLAAQDVAVKAAHVHTMTAAPTAAGTLVVKAGKIASVGASDATAEDFGSAHVYPGMVDAATVAGARAEKDDPVDPFMPGFRMVDAVDPRHRDFSRFAAHGVTTVHVLPGDRNVVGGTACAVKVASGDSATILKPVTGLKVSLRESEYAPPRGGGGNDLAARIFGGGGASGRDPTSLFGGMSLLRTPPAADAAAMAAWKDGKSRTFVATGTAREVDAALRLRADAALNPTVIGGMDVASRAKAAAENAAAVILPPLRPAMTPVEKRDLASLFAAGLPIAFSSGAPAARASVLRVSAASAVRAGVDAARVERALTVDAAKILGVDDRVGTLEAGKDGDFVVLSGPLSDPRSRLLLVVVDGRTAFRAPKE